MIQVAVKTHYSAAELAGMSLPGLPRSKGKMLAKAEREAWKFVESTGKGGIRRHYLPPNEVIAAINERATKQLVAVSPASTLPAVRSQATAAHTEAQTLVGDARKGVLDALNAIMERTGYWRVRLRRNGQLISPANASQVRIWLSSVKAAYSFVDLED